MIKICSVFLKIFPFVLIFKLILSTKSYYLLWSLHLFYINMTLVNLSICLLNVENRLIFQFQTIHKINPDINFYHKMINLNFFLEESSKPTLKTSLTYSIEIPGKSAIPILILTICRF